MAAAWVSEGAMGSVSRTCRMAGGVLVLFCVFLRTSIAANTEGCSAVRHAYGAKGYNKHDVPQQMVPGEHLRICPQGFTCCSQDMEHKLSTQSRQEFDKIMADKIGLLRNTFVSRTAKFDAFFTELLDNAKQDLHEMFVRTYGLLYQQNSHIFTDLFKDLRDYYKGRDVNLVDALDTFFTTLLQRMFELLNAQYTFDQAYLQCVSEYMDELKPFGDVPQKLSVEVRRSFIAARTFVQGLSIGRDVILAVSKLQPTSSCSKAVMKMKYCPYCRGLPNLDPCNNYCMNVMKGCLAHQSDLNTEWNNYISALMKLAEKLEGPFNIEMVVDPIDVKISDAIMNFQESSETVSTKVFSGCGQPSFGRKKRDAEPAAASYEEFSFGWKPGKKNNQQVVRPTTAAGTSLDRLVRDIKQKVEIAKDFWKDLPHKICNSEAAQVDNVNDCWNGQSKAKYQPEVMKDGVLAQNSNPEVDVDVRKPNSVINQQILQLKLITNKLASAYRGIDVDWIDTDTNDRGSGGHGHGHRHQYDGSGDGGSHHRGHGDQNDGSGSGQDDEHGSGGGYNGGYGWGEGNGGDISFGGRNGHKGGGSNPWDNLNVVDRQPPPKNRPDNQQTNNNGYQSPSGGGSTVRPLSITHRISLPWIVALLALLLVRLGGARH